MILTGICQSWKSTEIQFEEATDFVLWADLTEALSPDWVDLVAVSADEPKGIDRLGVLLAFVPQSCDRVCRPFLIYANGRILQLRSMALQSHLAEGLHRGYGDACGAPFRQ